LKCVNGTPDDVECRVNRRSAGRYPAERATSFLAAVALLATAPLYGCGPSRQDTPGPIQLTVWADSSPESVEGRLRIAQVESFEAAHPGTSVDLRQVTDPQDDYNDAVQAAIATGTLPDVLNIDGPNIASYAYQGALTPLDDLLDPQVRDRMLPSLVAQGTWNGHLWAVGAFDSGLAMWGDRSKLAAARVRVPQGIDDAWTAAEMSAALAALAAHDPDGKVLDIGRNVGTSEWLTYGFAPLLYSAGAGLLDPDTGRAAGALDSPDAVRAMRTLQDWTAYIEPPDADAEAFVGRRVALSVVGHWAYPPYHAALGPDLVLLPLPDLGNGTKSGQGSWAWAVGAGTAHPAAAASLVDWLTNDANAAATAAANGAVPGTSAALADSNLYGPGEPLELYADQLERSCGSGPVTRACVTVPRPVTPAYPTITAAFSIAVLTVLQGGDPQQALSEAARTIDTAIDLNDGYTQAPLTP
jgi:multiple sugar transport system substrate-binding protein